MSKAQHATILRFQEMGYTPVVSPIRYGRGSLEATMRGHWKPVLTVRLDVNGSWKIPDGPLHD